MVKNEIQITFMEIIKPMITLKMYDDGTLALTENQETVSLKRLEDSVQISYTRNGAVQDIRIPVELWHFLVDRLSI